MCPCIQCQIRDDFLEAHNSCIRDDECHAINFGLMNVNKVLIARSQPHPISLGIWYQVHIWTLQCWRKYILPLSWDWPHSVEWLINDCKSSLWFEEIQPVPNVGDHSYGSILSRCRILHLSILSRCLDKHKLSPLVSGIGHTHLAA